MLQKTLPLLLILLAFSAKAQNSKMNRVKPIEITASVVGVLDGNSQLAVIYVMKVDSLNDIGLERHSEVLTRFYFSTRPTNEPKLKGVKAGDVIKAEISGKPDHISGQMAYTIFRYSVLPPSEAKEKPSSEAGDPPHK